MGDSGSEGLSGHRDSFGAEHREKRNSPGSSSSGEIRKAVEQCLLSSSSTLDVSRKNIKHLTEEIYRQPSIKYFHLERNVISTIPEDLFQKLPHLVWLDLRYNKIKALPPGIGYHRQLKTLLLEKNPIKELPAELGNLTSLTALNLRHCPLEFPPKDVVRKGLTSILCFLRDSGKGKLLCVQPASPGFREPPEPVVYTEPSLCASHDLNTALEEMPRVEKLDLSELLQCDLDLSGEWPREEEKLGLEGLRGAALRAEEAERCGPRWGRGAARAGDVVQPALGTRCSQRWGRGAARAGDTVQPTLGTQCSPHWGRGAARTGDAAQPALGTRCSQCWGRGAAHTGDTARVPLGAGAAQRRASPAAQVTAARTARHEEPARAGKPAPPLENTDHLNTDHQLHWQMCG